MAPGGGGRGGVQYTSGDVTLPMRRVARMARSSALLIPTLEISSMCLLSSSHFQHLVLCTPPRVSDAAPRESGDDIGYRYAEVGEVGGGMAGAFKRADA